MSLIATANYSTPSETVKVNSIVRVDEQSKTFKCSSNPSCILHLLHQITEVNIKS